MTCLQDEGLKHEPGRDSSGWSVYLSLRTIEISFSELMKRGSAPWDMRSAWPLVEMQIQRCQEHVWFAQRLDSAHSLSVTATNSKEGLIGPLTNTFGYKSNKACKPTCEHSSSACLFFEICLGRGAELRAFREVKFSAGRCLSGYRSNVNQFFFVVLLLNKFVCLILSNNVHLNFSRDCFW